jgi:hypothetical protein
VRDNDIADCLRLKQQLRQLCIAGGRPDTLIRIPCQELEAWYLGDFAALAQAYNQPRLVGLAKKAKYRNPDAVPKPAVELERLIPGFQKQAAARKLGALLAEERNCSRSFQVFLAGIRRLAGEMCQELK